MRNLKIISSPLSIIKNNNGDVMHAIKNTDNGFNNFGEAYFTWISSNSIKAWKKHLKMTMNLVVPIGEVRFVFKHENSEGSDDFIIKDIGQKKYERITVPPGIWFGFKGISEKNSLVLNIASIPHDPDEVERKEISEINYNWG